MEFDFSIITQYGPLIAESAGLTLQLFVASLLLGTGGGLVLALMRLSPNRVLSALSASYVWLFRGIPPLIVLFFTFYALPQFGVSLSALQAGIVGLGLVAAAYKAEIIRSGVISVDLGQWEASEALAMSKPHFMRRIILPQAIRIMIPPYMSNTITLLKSTSLASVITITEITGISNRLISSTFKAFEILTVAALIYLALNTVLVGIQILLERTFALKS
jgi:His/Glu/Gln/Arg/opine family amino acid ABC transporter permease subunit